MILRAIDNLNRGDHFYLTPEDQCMFLREYTTGGGWQHSDSNQLILNLKKSPSLRLTAPKQHYWKERAIDQAAGELRQALNLPSLSGITFVPIPPSKSKTDPEYDDRLVLILRKTFSGHTVDIRELLVQPVTRASHHGGTISRSIPGLMSGWQIDERFVTPAPSTVILFDDVLTTGASFIAAKQKLQDALPSINRVIGIFIARRAIPTALDDFA